MFIYKSATTKEDLGNGVTRRVMAHGGRMMAVEVTFEKDAVGAIASSPP